MYFVWLASEYCWKTSRKHPKSRSRANESLGFYDRRAWIEGPFDVASRSEDTPKAGLRTPVATKPNDASDWIERWLGAGRLDAVMGVTNRLRVAWTPPDAHRS